MNKLACAKSPAYSGKSPNGPCLKKQNQQFSKQEVLPQVTEGLTRPTTSQALNRHLTRKCQRRPPARPPPLPPAPSLHTPNHLLCFSCVSNSPHTMPGCLRRCPCRGLRQKGVVHVDGAAPAGIVVPLRGVPERAHAAPHSGRRHAQAAVVCFQASICWRWRKGPPQSPRIEGSGRQWQQPPAPQ